MTVLDACPNCESDDDIIPGHEYDSGTFSEETTVCLGCDRVFDAEAEWVTDRQNQKTLEAYVDRRDGGDIFEAKNRMRWFTFITNLDVSEEEARALREYYHYRWAIESAYGSYKTHFLPGTRSTNLGLRTYLYLFGISAFNAWVASNVKARRQHLEDNERNRPPIRASRFTTLGQQRYRTDEFLTESINFEVD